VSTTRAATCARSPPSKDAQVAVLLPQPQCQVSQSRASVSRIASPRRSSFELASSQGGRGLLLPNGAAAGALAAFGAALEAGTRGLDRWLRTASSLVVELRGCTSNNRAPNWVAAALNEVNISGLPCVLPSRLVQMAVWWVARGIYAAARWKAS
jgi:hypothetical protein